MLVIDGTYLIYKSYYRTKKINDTYGIENKAHFVKVARNMFLKLLASIKNRFQPTHLFIVFDNDGENFRHKLLPSYKSNRKEKPEELSEIKNEVYHFLRTHNFSFQVADNVEGDDLIASFIHCHPDQKIQVFTGDADMGAIVGKNATLLLEKPSDSKKKIYEITNKNFHHFFPVPPHRMPDFKCLQGDKSDFIKGVDGLFRSETIHLLMEFDSVEEFFERGQNHYLYDKIVRDKNKILINKVVSSLKYDCKITRNIKDMKIELITLPEKISSKVGWKA